MMFLMVGAAPPSKNIILDICHFFSRATIVARLTSMWAMQEHKEVVFFVIFAGAAAKITLAERGAEVF
jgi:hypothetical protein